MKKPKRNTLTSVLFIILVLILVIKGFDGFSPTESHRQPFKNISHLILTKHAKCRMECRDITEEEIKEILHDGNINYMKSNLNDERGPTYALEGYSHEHQHLRIVFSPKKEEMVVVTCIDLDKEAECDCN